jgi:hypothetical protein
VLTDPRHLRRHPAAPRPVAVRWALSFCAVTLALNGTFGALAPAAQADVASGPSAPAEAPEKIEDFAPYVPQKVCDPVAKPGTTALAKMVLAYYDTGRNGGITRACSIGARSEHKDGRAWDWMVSVSKPSEKATAERFLAWLTAEGPDGEDAYNARRLGVMYLIWNHRIWTAGRADSGWRPYRGSNPHTSHVHVSLSWSGAMKQTSWWTAVRADVTTGRSDVSIAVAGPEE